MRALSFVILSASLLAAPAVPKAQDVVTPPGEDVPHEDLFGPAPPDPALSAPPPSAEAAPSPAPPADPAERLDQLFAELKREASAEASQEIASRIQAEWLDSGSATTDLLMGWSAEAIANENYAAAFDLLDQVIVLDGAYAEAWNRRATLHFQLSRYGQSIADIEQTLLREPRHFGALMGLAAILETLDRKEDALEAYMRVLDVYPAMKGAQEAVGRLADETSGQPI